MSNHQGSYLLNDVITMLKQENVFALLGTEKTISLLRNLVNLAQREYDCNSDEILEGHGEQLGICYNCLRKSDEIKENGLCSHCFETLFKAHQD